MTYKYKGRYESYISVHAHLKQAVTVVIMKPKKLSLLMCCWPINANFQLITTISSSVQKPKLKTMMLNNHFLSF